MMEITINIPGLLELAEAIKGINPPTITAAAKPEPDQAKPEAVQYVRQPYTRTAEPVAEPAPEPAPVEAAPVAEVKPQYTKDDIARAAGQLMRVNPQARQQLKSLLEQFNVVSVPALGEDQLDAFATEMRGLGADI